MPYAPIQAPVRVDSGQVWRPGVVARYERQAAYWASHLALPAPDDTATALVMILLDRRRIKRLPRRRLTEALACGIMALAVADVLLGRA